MSLADGQGGYRVRFDWGPVGADAVSPGAAYVAVVDVLSFTTTLTVAVEQGLHVLPYRWRDDSAVAVARLHGAMLAVLRKEAGPGQVTGAVPVADQVDLLARYVDYLPANLYNARVPAFVSLDTRIAWQYGKRLELSLNGQNLLQKRHLEFGNGSFAERGIFGKITWRH